MYKIFQKIIFLLYALSITSLSILIFLGTVNASKNAEETTENISEEIEIQKSTVWIDQNIPSFIADTTNKFISSREDYVYAKNSEEADIVMKNTEKVDPENIIYKEYFVPVTNFSSLTDDISMSDFVQKFTSKTNEGKYHLLEDDDKESIPLANPNNAIIL